MKALKFGMLLLLGTVIVAALSAQPQRQHGGEPLGQRANAVGTLIDGKWFYSPLKDDTDRAFAELKARAAAQEARIAALEKALVVPMKPADLPIDIKKLTAEIQEKLNKIAAEINEVREKLEKLRGK